MSDAFNDYLDSLEQGLAAEVPPEEVEYKDKDENKQKKNVSRLVLTQKVEIPKEIKDKPLEAEYEPQIKAKAPDNEEISRRNTQEELMRQSGTYFEEDWIKLYLEALASKNDNYVARKMRSGKFRLNKQHTVELLSEFDIYDKTPNEILDRNYD